MPAKKAAAAISKPTYAVMVADSIKTLNDRTGSSMQAIVKQLQSQYKFDINKPALVKAIKKGVEAGDLVQIKASYKLNKKAPASKTKKVTTVIKKKPVAKSSTTRKATITKRTTKPRKTIMKKTSTKRTGTATKKSTRKVSTRKATTTKKKGSKK